MTREGARARQATGRAVCLLLVAVLSASAQEDPAAMSQRAAQAMQAGRYAEAVTLFRNLVRMVPNEPRLRLNLGLALHSQGNYREAVEQLQIALRQNASLEPGWFMLGLDDLKLNQPQKAVDALEHALKLDPTDDRARLELASTLLSLGKAEEASREFRRLTEKELGNAKAWQGLGLAYVALSRQWFAALDHAGPGSAFADALLAHSLIDQGQYRTAFYWYHQAIAQNSELPGAHAELAEIYRRTDHADWAAVEDGRDRAAPKPDCTHESAECDFLAGRFDAVISFTRGSSTPESYYWRTRAYEELALDTFRHLAEIPPTAEIHELLAEADVARHNFHGAVDESRQAVKLAPDDAKAEEELGRTLWLDHDYAEARPLLDELVKKEPESAALNCAFGDTLLALGSVSQAIPYLEKAVRLAPDLAPAQASLGRAYLRSGRAHDAIPHLKASLGGNEEVQSLYQLAEAYKKAGQSELAKETMQKFEVTSNSALARTQELDLKHDITPP